MVGGNRPGKPASVERQCTAHSKRSGKRCQRPAIVGGTVCTTHGGSAPQVRRRAQERIDAAAARMVDVVVTIASDTEEEARDRIVAAREVLNRSSEVNQPQQTVKHEGGVSVQHTAAQEMIDAARETLKGRRIKGKAFALDNAIDAEVVEDE